MHPVKNVRLNLAWARRILASSYIGLASTPGSHARYSCKGTIEMTRHFAARPVRLNTGELLDITDGEGFTVECLDGVVWITQSSDPRDIVLNAGQSFVLDKPGLALVCAAAGPATIAVEVSLRLSPPLVPYRWSMQNAGHGAAAI
jgi:hypothetical protein